MIAYPQSGIGATKHSFLSRAGRLTIGRRLTTCPTLRACDILAQSPVTRELFKGERLLTLSRNQTESVLRPGRPIENRPRAGSLPYISLTLLLAACFSGSAIAQSTTFNLTGTVQPYMVPAGVTKVTIDASGAVGGAGGPTMPLGNASAGGPRPRLPMVFPGGAGAHLVATFTVTPGETLNVVVGGAGATNLGIGGGGGGSFVYRMANAAGLLIAAAGGGGGSQGSAGNAGSATTTASGGQSSGATGGAAGTGGSGGGGGGGGPFMGGGGGGLLTNGGNGTSLATGGQALANGAAGGGGGAGGAGGFGGGGAGDISGAGGGGGYNGGGGGAGLSGFGASGGGGGSFSATTPSVAMSGSNTSNGVVVITVVPADISVTKSGPAVVTAGTNITYTVTVVNGGPSDAQSVMLSDALPANTTFVSEMQTTGPAFNCANVAGSVNCSIATLANGASATFTIVDKVGANVANGSMITNTATVTSTTPDPTSPDNTATVNSTVTNSADLSVTKTGPATVGAGNNITYTVTVMNGGPNDAQSVTLSDALPPGTTFVSEAQTAGPAFTCTNPAVGGTGAVSCTLTTLANGASATFTIVYKVGASVSNGTTITNTANVTSTTPDPNSANNTSSSTSTVTNSADVSVTKTGPATINAGNNITYTVSVMNSGPNDAQSVTLTDALPAGTTFVSETQTSGPAFNCTNPAVGGTGSVSCTLATLANGASASFTIVYKVGATVANGSTITNTATVSSTTNDPNSANNSASSSASVNGSADLSITKSGPATVTSGQNIVYTIVATNNGPGTATGVTVSDPAPAGATFVSNSGGCTTPFPCNLGTLTNGQSVTITATYSVNAGAANGSTITNTATVSSPVTDPNPANNSATSSATVGVSADVSIIKTGPAAVTFNTNASYMITVSNAGPSNSSNVVVTDVIPSNASFVSATPSQGSCSGTATVTCSLGTVNAGSSATIALVLHVNSGTAVTNTATVTADTADPNLANNSSTTGVIPVTPLPSTLILIIVGLGALALYRARRRFSHE
jgi:uncharacterized repeat protein (TIGR01451 family)